VTKSDEGVITGARSIPIQLSVGSVLIAIAWPLAWFGPAPLSGYTFFPLWLGYILVVDGLTLRRSGTSLLSRNGRRFLFLFACSIPCWWVFEFANRFLGNWVYIQPSLHHPLAYTVLASLAFSTVMPAIFVTAGLYRTFRPFSGPRRWITIAPSPPGLVGIAALGLIMVVAALAAPNIAFPFMWIGFFLIVDAVNARTGSRSIAGQVAVGRWDTVLVLFAAGFTCGLFWEMWNYWSLPKWEYDVPHVGQPRLFEMPLLGYGGYLPFALEIYAFYHAIHNLVFRAVDRYLGFDDAVGHGS
jgi:hypothetical protein